MTLNLHFLQKVFKVIVTQGGFSFQNGILQSQSVIYTNTFESFHVHG